MEVGDRVNDFCVSGGPPVHKQMIVQKKDLTISFLEPQEACHKKHIFLFLHVHGVFLFFAFLGSFFETMLHLVRFWIRSRSFHTTGILCRFLRYFTNFKEKQVL